MKKIYLLLLGSFLFVTIQGQMVMEKMGKNSQLNPNELVVIDSSGMVYPTFLWQKLMQSGKYKIQILPDKKNALIVHLTEEEIERRLNAMPKPRESQFFVTGKKITTFSERDMNGTKFNMKELLGKVVVLNFWFINCMPCRMEMPDLNELVDDFKENTEVVFIAIGLDDKYNIADFLKTQPFKYHIIDSGNFLVRQYGVNSYPTHVVVDRQGKVLFHSTGLGSNTVPWVKKSIREALSKEGG